MRRRTVGRVFALIALVAPSLAIGLAADVQEIGVREQRARMEVRGGTVALRHSISDTLSLTVVGDGYRSTERFSIGQVPTFAPVDARGFSLPDGVYTWELVATPGLPSTRSVSDGVPANGRATHQAPAAAGRSQSGAFTILNGRIVDPTLTEEGAGQAIGAPMHKHPHAVESGAAATHHDSDRATLESQ